MGRTWCGLFMHTADIYHAKTNIAHLENFGDEDQWSIILEQRKIGENMCYKHHFNLVSLCLIEQTHTKFAIRATMEKSGREKRNNFDVVSNRI